MQLELETVSEAIAFKAQEEVKLTLRDKGMEPITLSPADAKSFVATAYEAKWKFSKEKYPEWGPKMYDLWAKP